ncbi:MAG: M15 family metallopeptidase [Beijerinckiaceae bacterium]
MTEQIHTPTSAFPAKTLDLQEVQSKLAATPLFRDEADGAYGEDTRRALQATLASLGVAGWQNWPRDRLLVAGKQALCALEKIDSGRIDGLMGPQTRHAIAVYEARLNGVAEPESWRDAQEAAPPLVVPKTAAHDWPRQKDCLQYYGRPGENQTRLHFPYPMRLAWDTKTIVRSTLCHEKIHDAAQRVLARVLDHYGEERIRTLGLDLFGGCLNVRKMRGGSAWSMHSWGIAFDFDPERNQLKWARGKAEMSKPAYDSWFDLWEEEGAVSLGRARNFDWMHVQFARL